jgi:hypothetical protein
MINLTTSPPTSTTTRWIKYQNRRSVDSGPSCRFPTPNQESNKLVFYYYPHLSQSSERRHLDDQYSTHFFSDFLTADEATINLSVFFHMEQIANFFDVSFENPSPALARNFAES